MSSGLSVSATIVNGVFAWKQTGEPQRLPSVIEAAPLEKTVEWSTPILGFVGKAMLGAAVLLCVGWSVKTISLEGYGTPTTLAAMPDEPITTGSIKPLLRSTIGTDDDERGKALARAAALSSRQDEAGRRAIDMIYVRLAEWLPSP